MTIKSIIAAAVVIGTSSLALAHPASEGGVEVRDHRYEQPAAIQYTAPAPAPAPIVASWGHRPMWMTLSTGDKLNRSGSEYIRLSAFKPIKTLKLQATRGTTSIKDVTIQFANGQSQTVCLNQTLSGNAAATIDLTGNYRKVVSLSVTGSSSRRASFEVLGV